MLPLPNYDAKKPADVYTLDSFLPKSTDDNASGMLESEALEFFKKYATVEALVEIGTIFIGQLFSEFIRGVHNRICWPLHWVLVRR